MMKSYVFRICFRLKVVGTIIGFIFIHMMSNFAINQWTTKLLFQNHISSLHVTVRHCAMMVSIQ